MKSWGVAALLFSAILFYISATASAGNLLLGTQGPYDRLLARDIIKKDAPWFTKNKLQIRYPPKGHEDLGRLSAIVITDNGGRDNYATAKLVEGGPGAFTSTIEVKSQTRRPIDMIIEYYGQ